MATTVDVTTENGTFYTWNSANFGWNDARADKTWSNAANTLAAVNVGEPYAISDVMRPNINKRLLESIHVADTMKTSLQILRKDVLSIGETYWDNINFALKIAESFVVNELRKSTITAIRKDQINFTEKVIKTDNKYFYEAFATQETALRSLNKIVSESFHLLETSNQAVTFLRTLAESLAVNEVLNKNVQYTREFAETIAVVQTYWDNINFALRLIESIGISESEANTVQFHRTLAESLAVADVMNYNIARLVMILETLGISDFGGRAVDYKRTVLENIGTADLASQAVTFKRLFAELIKAQALNAPAITSPTFTRASTAYKQDGSVVAAGEPRFERSKKNLFNGVFYSGWIDLTTGVISPYNEAYPFALYSDAIPVIGGATYTCSGHLPLDMRFRMWRRDNSFIGTLAMSGTGTVPSDCAYMRLLWYQGLTDRVDIQLELGAVATAYEPYQLGLMVEEGTVNLALYSGLQNHNNTTNGSSSIVKENFNINGTNYAGVTWVQGPTSEVVVCNIFNSLTNPSISSSRKLVLSCLVNSSLQKFAKAQIRATIDGVYYYLNQVNSADWNGTSSDEAYLIFDNLPALNSWVKHKFILPALPAGNVTELRINGFYRTNSNFTAKIANVQVEAKDYPTSLMPTNGAIATRSSESFTVPTGVIPNEGTITFDCYITDNTNSLNPGRDLFAIGGPLPTNGLWCRKEANSTLYNVYLRDNVGAVAGISAISFTVGYHKIKYRYSSSGVALSIDGAIRKSEKQLDIQFNSPFSFGSTNTFPNAYFSNLHISKKVYSDEELAYTGPLVIDENTTYFAPLTEDLDASVYESGEIVKDVEKPLAEAISASESNSKGYGLKKSESFAAADVVKKTAGKKILETLHIAETYWDNVNFALRILEAFAIQEGQHRNITHSAKETLGVGEFVSKHDKKFTFENIVAQELNLKATTKKLSETLTTIDATTQIVNFLRTVAETLHVAEAPAQAVDFRRLFTEAAHMADSYKSSVNKELREIFSISQEQKFVDMDKLAKENVGVAEAAHRTLATLHKETLHIAETYWDNIAFIVRCLENIHVGEVINNVSSFKRTWNENVAFAENAARINEFNRLWQEAFGTTEGYTNAVQFIRKTYETLWVNEGPKKNTAKALQDAFAISDLAAKLVGKPLQEALRVTDKKTVNVAKLLQDTLHVVDFIDRNIAFIRKFFETFGAGDKIARNIETLLRDNFSMADKAHSNYQKAISENLAMASDTFGRQVDFKLKIEEVISSIEGVAMEYGLEINEAINLLDSYITNVKAVLSNIAIREGEMTLADFQNAIATPPGYNTFRDFVVGDYEYQKALMRIVINAPATASQPVIKDVVPYVDIEDTDDKGEVTITQTATATKVYFNKFYYNAPEVNVTLKGGSGAITPNIVSTTGQDEGGRYFEVELLNSSGARVTGTFSWTSKGY